LLLFFLVEPGLTYSFFPSQHELRLGYASIQPFLLQSNALHCLITALSLKLEKFLAKLEAEGVEDDLDESLEDKAMKLAQEEIYEESGRQFQPWCANGKSLRMGEIVLIIDTIVPEDCFRDAAREMFESPDCAIIQHESGTFLFVALTSSSVRLIASFSF